MTGKKGQKWNTDRPAPRVKSSVSLKPELFDRVKEIADDRRWTVSATIEYIIEEYFKGE